MKNQQQLGTTEPLVGAETADSVREDAREPERAWCGCRGQERLIYGPDPFASEIHGDETPVWECEECHAASCMEI